MTEPVDMVIPAAPKDYNKLPYVISAVRELIKVETIHVIAPSPSDIGHSWNNVILHSDDEILPYDRSRLNWRPNWVFQQLLKMFQEVTRHDWFLVMDADIFAARPIPLWSKKGKPILYLGRDQRHGPYFTFNRYMLGYGKVHPWSFLSECTLYNKRLIREMLTFCNLTRDQFWERLLEITNVLCCPADAELYGSYVTHEHPGLYEIRHLNATLGGRYGGLWSDKEIEDELKRVRSSCGGVHLISLHSWGDDLCR